MLTRISALAVLVFATGPLYGDVLQQAAELRDAALKENGAFELVESLTAEVGPRIAGSAGDRASIVWAVETLKELGFERVWTEPVSVPHWDRGETSVVIDAPFPQPLAAVTLGGSVGTPEQGITAPVVGVDSLTELRQMPADSARGKILYLGQRTDRTRDASGYARSVAGRVLAPSEAARVGAVAVVIRSVGTSNNRFAHTGTTRYLPGKRRVPAFALSNPDADVLEYQMRKGKTVTLTVFSSARRLGSERSANVLAEFRGADPDAGLVLLGAHLDSWDLGTGALDDGVGVAIVVEAARQIAAIGRPRRTIRVVLFANEEAGLSGANAYALGHEEELPYHRLAIEADLGAGPVWQVSSRVAPESWDSVVGVASLLEPLAVGIGNNEASGGADLSPLLRAGVPILALAHDATDYFDYHHTANDTLDKVDRQALNQTVAAYAAAMFVAANGEDPWPMRDGATTN